VSFLTTIRIYNVLDDTKKKENFHKLCHKLFPPDALREINSLLYVFLWDNKGNKIKRTKIVNDYDKGGLKIIFIASMPEIVKTKMDTRLFK